MHAPSCVICAYVISSYNMHIHNYIYNYIHLHTQHTLAYGCSITHAVLHIQEALYIIYIVMSMVPSNIVLYTSDLRVLIFALYVYMCWCYNYTVFMHAPMHLHIAALRHTMLIQYICIHCMLHTQALYIQWSWMGLKDYMYTHCMISL